MKKSILLVGVAVLASLALESKAQRTSSLSTLPLDGKIPAMASPRDSIVSTLNSGATVTITYGSPGIWGRKVGSMLEPKEDTVWRAGANEATTFAVDRAVTIEGKQLPAGKYAMFAKRKGNNWTFIFNKTWNTWGAYDYAKNMAEDALQVTVQEEEGSFYNERLKYVVVPMGEVYLMWDKFAVGFSIK